MNFIFELSAPARRRNPATALHLMVAVMLFGIAIASAFLFWFTSVSPNFQSPYFPFALFGLVCLIVSVALVALTVRQRKSATQSNKLSGWLYVELAVLLLGAVLFLFQKAYMPALLFTVMALAVAFASFSAAKRNNTGKIIFSDKQIQVPGRLRPYPWREVNKILFRHGTLTIELSGNRIWQNLATTEADPEIFDAWVDSQLTKYADERAKEW